MSHQLKELKNQLGFKVFHRTRNKWELIEEGEELNKLGVSILESIDKGFEHIQQIRKGSKGTIKLSTECYSFYQGLLGFLQKIGVLYPEIKVELILEATHQPISKVLSNEIDIAIVTYKPGSELLIIFEVFEDEIFAIMHKENSLNRLDFLEASDFTDVHLIIHSFPLETVSILEQFLKPNNIVPLRISAIPLTEVALEMIGANLGITCMT